MFQAPVVILLMSINLLPCSATGIVLRLYTDSVLYHCPILKDVLCQCHISCSSLYYLYSGIAPNVCMYSTSMINFFLFFLYALYSATDAYFWACTLLVSYFMFVLFEFCHCSKCVHVLYQYDNLFCSMYSLYSATDPTQGCTLLVSYFVFVLCIIHTLLVGYVMIFLCQCSILCLQG